MFSKTIVANFCKTEFYKMERVIVLLNESETNAFERIFKN